ncbi:SAM-dependent methyltransferase [Ferruginibacter albus]|uniref:SAM-dependent methyltransferase n=1 Tax=Ferruginibacter albus TaxID=2875540 RepID=UPI001CC42921|nr:SAM-dependent methyltransferase [Ferruginibacter albus]UAY51410.1 SAM-dependent methyltransferase [Ferruginibacter albus]
MSNIVYLIPTVLDEMATHTILPYTIDAIKDSKVIFAENERTARRFLKSIDKTIVIDDYEWFTIHKTEEDQRNVFIQKIKENKNIAIISEAGCPGVADPGQLLIETAQQLNAIVKPLVGPSSILLALMASGMNGQQFQFIGYLPINQQERIHAVKELEIESRRKNCTQIFIETPYRNNQLIELLLKTCQSSTRICIAAELTSANEYIKTKTVTEWKKEKVDFHKRPVIFLLKAS